MNVRFGVTDPGSIASRFAAVLGDTDGVTLTAVAAASSKNKAEKFAAEYGANNAYGSYEELVNDDQDGLLVDSFESEPTDGFVYQIMHFADLYRKGLIESDLIPHQDNVACGAVFDTLLGKEQS